MEKKRKPQIPYEMVVNETKEVKDSPLSKVIGYESQKEELKLVLDWFKNYEFWKSKHVTLPKGVLLYGSPGNGKTLLIREAIKYSSLPAFIFKGDVGNVANGLEKTFKKARETGLSIVVIDELDLLIDKDSKVKRIIQQNLDGIDSNDNVLVFAATNNINEIPDALLRNGRLDKIMHIPYPTGKEAVELLKMNFNVLGVSLPDDFDENELSLTLDNISCVGVRAIANDIVLRNGFKNLTSQMVVDSIYRITNRVQDKNKNIVYATAVHEAGHAVMATYFKEFFDITRLDIHQEGGELCIREKEEDFWPYDKIIADIMIAYAGVLAQKIICGVGSCGCERDLQRARSNAWGAINSSGYFRCSDTLPDIKPYSNVRSEPEKKKTRNVKKADHLLRKCEKDTIHYLKKHKDTIERVAKALFDKKFLLPNEVLSIING